MELLHAYWAQQEEGSILCDGTGMILLCNPAARSLLGKGCHEGASVFDLFSPAPIAHAMEMLRCARRRQTETEQQGGTRFLCTAVDVAGLFRCCVRPLQLAAAEPLCFVIALKPGGVEEDQPSLLPVLVEELRQPLANLRAAADTLTAPQDLPSVMRSAFENILVQECVALTGCFENLVNHSRKADSQMALFSAIWLPDLICCLNHRLEQAGVPRVSGSGGSVRVLADSHELLLLLELFVGKINALLHPAALRWETGGGDRIVFIDLVWPGLPLRPLEIEGWLQEPLAESVRGQRVADALRRHDSEIWSQPHAEVGYALLRVPLPTPVGR